MEAHDAVTAPQDSLAQLSAHKCTKCGRTKSLEDFYTKGYRRDSRCKDCVSAIKKARYRATTKAKARSRADGNRFSVTLTGRVGSTAIENFSTVIAESVRSLMDEGKI